MWQATLFAALVLCVTYLLRDGQARLRYALWLVAAAKFAAPSALLAPLAARLGLGQAFLSAPEPGAAGPLFLRLTEPVAAAAAADSSGPVVSAYASGAHAEWLCALTL